MMRNGGKSKWILLIEFACELKGEKVYDTERYIYYGESRIPIRISRNIVSKGM